MDVSPGQKKVAVINGRVDRINKVTVRQNFSQNSANGSQVCKEVKKETCMKPQANLRQPAPLYLSPSI